MQKKAERDFHFWRARLLRFARDSAKPGEMSMSTGRRWEWLICAAMIFGGTAPRMAAQERAAPAGHAARRTPPSATPAQPKLVVMIVVDQMRADYVDKFRGQWSGGLKRMTEQGAWFRDAAYPYAATETCVGHATISTGALPATHGIIANAWWDREQRKNLTCTADPKAKNVGYAGASVKGGDSAWKLQVPTFSDELRFQRGAGTRVVTFSLKARAAIMLAGHRADAATWFDMDAGTWVTSNVYGSLPFIDDYAKAHPVKQEHGKTWALSLPQNEYWYKERAVGAVPPEGWDATFPHALRGKSGSGGPDADFYEQWETSPYADTYLTKLAETSVDQLGLGKSGGVDFLGISYSSVDYVGHAFGPRSWEMQDILVRLDKDLGELFTHLDATVGRGNYVVALSADHGGTPVPEDMAGTGANAGLLHTSELAGLIEQTLNKAGYPNSSVERMDGADIYFAPGIYKRLKADKPTMAEVLEAVRSFPGVEKVYRAEELLDRPATQSPLRRAEAASYYAGRSGDLLVAPKAYYLLDWTPAGKERDYATGHGGPWYYDQHVPLLLMGYGIQPGQYHDDATPADIAPTLAALCDITLASRDGHVLAEALAKPRAKN